MEQLPVSPEQIADDVARQLLERATVLEGDGPTLSQLRQGAMEAGISSMAFDAAVAEWRAQSPTPVVSNARGRWVERGLRNFASLAVGYCAVATLAATQGVVDAPWLVHKMTDPIGLGIGAFVAIRLRARSAAILLGGLAVSQGAEFLMDLFSGAPAVRGFGAHMALMIAGVAGIAIGAIAWGRRGGLDGAPSDPRPEPSDTSHESRPVGATRADAVQRLMEMLRLRRSSYLIRLQPS